MYNFAPGGAGLCVAVPGLAGLGTGAGAGLIATAAHFPPDIIGYWAAGTGLVVASTGAIVALHGWFSIIGASIQYRTKALEMLPRPAVQEEPEYIPEELEPGMNPVIRDAKTGKIIGNFASEQEIYLPGDDGWTEIYNVRVSYKALERLYEVVKSPRKDSKIPIVNDDFTKGNKDEKIFTPYQFKRFQRELEIQHIGVGGRGNRFYLTERGRRVIIQKWERINTPLLHRKGRV